MEIGNISKRQQPDQREDNSQRPTTQQENPTWIPVTYCYIVLYKYLRL